jgi:hypothetical protein
MDQFKLSSDMLTMTGAFYPTGYVFAMFPEEAQARHAGQSIEQHKLSGKPVLLLPPQVVLDQIVRTVGHADQPLPSAGTESNTVRHYAALASQGHWALMVHAPQAEDVDRLRQLLEEHACSFAEKYRRLVIEDLVQTPKNVF